MKIYQKNIERQKNIIALLEKGNTRTKIAKLYKISTERVRQIINKRYYIIHESSCEACKKTFLKKDSHHKYCPYCSRLQKNLQGRERTRELTRVRDNHTCQSCGLKWDENMRKFDVHHLNGNCGKYSKGYDRIKDISSLITLCHKCHMNLEEVKRKTVNHLSPRPNKPKK